MNNVSPPKVSIDYLQINFLKIKHLFQVLNFFVNYPYGKQKL